MVAVGIDQAQRVIDTRAIEIAQSALTAVEIHQRQDDLQHAHTAKELAEIKSDTRSALSEIKEDLRSGFRTLSNRQWAAAGGGLMAALMAAGTLLLFVLEHSPH